MIVLSLLAALAACASVFLAITALPERPASPLVLRPRRGALQLRQDAVDQSRPAPRILHERDHGLAERLPFALAERAAQKLAQAGSPMSPGRFLLFGGGFGLAFPVVIIAVLASAEAGRGNAAVMLGALVLGPAVPYVWLNGRIRRRRAAIIKSLPDAFDLLTTCVEAGLGLDAALTRVAGRVRGPFGDELGRTVRELGMGRPRREAMRDLAQRTRVEDLELFVSALLQAEQMGSSIGEVLRVQSEQMRRRRRQRAEQQAHKAPVKMMLPLVTMIFPSLFVVVLGPAVIQFVEVF